MARIDRIKDVRKTLKGLVKKYTVEDSASVGFAQSYAVHVHEMEMKNAGKPRKKPAKGMLWEPGQNKYLEQPARQLSSSGELGRIIRTAVSKGVPITKALVLATLRLQREAQKLVPIDTGALRASAFTSPTKDEEAAAQRAKAKGDAKRSKVLTSRQAKKGKRK